MQSCDAWSSPRCDHQYWLVKNMRTCGRHSCSSSTECGGTASDPPAFCLPTGPCYLCINSCTLHVESSLTDVLPCSTAHRPPSPSCHQGTPALAACCLTHPARQQRMAGVAVGEGASLPPSPWPMQQSTWGVRRQPTLRSPLWRWTPRWALTRWGAVSGISVRPPVD